MAQTRLDDFTGWTVLRSSSSATSAAASPMATCSGRRQGKEKNATLATRVPPSEVHDEETSSSVTRASPRGTGEKTPTSVTASPWIYESRMENADYPEAESGKWMMFYAVSQVDRAWSRAKELYRSGQLPGVNSMKVSTAMPTGHSTKESVMIFYCGPASNEQKMMVIGGDLAEKMKYGKSAIYYKTDLQTIRGERGSTYRINLS